MKLKFLSRGSDSRFGASSIHSASLALLSLASLLAAAPLAEAQVGFSASLLGGLVSGGNNKASKVTSLQFGPDNRLYFTQVNGTVIACDVTRMGPNNYVASNVETINLVKEIPNYNDDGVRNLTLNGRQCTGILVTGSAANPVIYVTSCDPREGAGSGAIDLNLDTNSGIISRLTRNGSGVWEKVDLVRGLPRSEENHACNGLNLSADGNTLFLAQGGNTNAGGPSNNFAFSCETALAAAVLSIDLPAIEAMPVQIDAYGQHYVYNIPTLNDPNPSRTNVVPADADHADVNDPFGGNDGLNQAKLVPGGPVQVYASGFRNPYDVLIAKTPGRVGKMYTFDNAGNSGWGGYPVNEAVPATVTNEYDDDEVGTVNNKDGLYLIPGPGYYRGHPNPIRANPGGAGWLRNDEGGAGIVFSPSPTVDWPPVPVSMADPQQGDFKLPGPADGALITNSASTTGLAEYTASNFGGAMVGNIITTQYSAATVQRITMNADGTAVTGSSVLLNGSSYGTPLDVTCPGPGAAPALSGTIFVGHHSSKITILEPTDFDSGSGGVCSGVFSFALDEDNDGYSNADEISNNSDACSPAVMPPDHDGDYLSDLLDSDDDNDGLADTQDVFPIDALNGLDVAPPVRRELFNELGIGFFSIGFKGVMLNPGENYSQKMNVDDLIAGGTAGLFTDPGVGPGNPHGSSNTQLNAFHFGVNVDEFGGPYLASSGLGGLLFNGTPTDDQSQGIFLGNGDQDNYVKVAVHANSGSGGIEVVHEEDGVIESQVLHPVAGLFSGNVKLYFRIDPIAGTVHPGYSIGAGPVTYVGSPLAVEDKVLGAIRGSSAMAFGLLATTGDVMTPTFNATWDYFDVSPVAGTAAARLTVCSPGGSLATSSTNSGGSFRLENLSTGGQKITSVKVDLRTAMLPDIVFDPDHTAGDHDGKEFEADTFDGTGLASIFHTFESPHNGVDGLDGFSVLHVHCDAGVDFGPGKLLTFSSDIDPNNIKGVMGPGPDDAGSISGLELIGATITVTFDDGSVRKVRNGGYTESPSTLNPNKTSVGMLSPANLPTPGLSVPGQVSPFVTTTQPTVRVVGPPGTDVEVGVFHSALHLNDGTLVVPNGGYDIDPYESNCVVAYDFIDTTIGVNGFVDVPLSLDHSETLGGINLVSAVLRDGSGNRSASSDILTIDYDPNATPATALFRINGGGGSYLDSAGQTWTSDSYFSSGNTSTFANAIAGTIDDTLYQSFRYDDSPSTPLDYNFPVANGQYQVKLHFAETWSGITAAGQRVFDVQLEGAVVVNDLDVFATAGPNTAHIETLQTTVSDGQLTIGLRHVVQNPFLCGIEIFQLGTTGPDEEAPTAPGVLTHTLLEAGRINLAWSQATDLVGVAGYRVYRGDDLIGDTALLSLMATGLTPTTEYTFGVEAYDAAGNVSERTTLTVSTTADQQDPTTPGSLKGVAGNELAVLTWTASSDDAAVAGYYIYRDGGAVPIATVTGLTHTDTGLTNGTIYDYEVVAYDVVGKVSAGATVSVRPRALGPAVLRVNCGGPLFTDLASQEWAADFGFNTGVAETSTGAIAGTGDDGLYQARRFDRSHGAELKYTFPLPDGEYELRLHFAEVWTGATTAGVRVFDVKVEDQLALDNFDIFAAAGFSTAHIETIPVTVTGGQITIEFLHVVQHPTIAGIEIYGLEAGPPDLDPPPVPQDLAVTEVTAGSVSLSWTASEEGATYDVRRGGNTVGSTTGTSFTETGLTANTAYSYTVTARDAAGNTSDPSSPANATTSPDTIAPSAPGSLTASPGNAAIVLSWLASTDNSTVSHYEIYRNSSTEPVATVTDTGYTDTGLTNGTLYHYEVVAVDGVGLESEPAAASATPLALGPALVRVDAGNVAASYTDSEGNVWAADYGYNSTNKTLSSTTAEIAGTPMPELYQTSRLKNRQTTAPLRYEFAVANGSYEVRLHFAETYSPINAAGQRVFNVLVEGETVLPNLDIFAEVGLNHALVKSIPTTVTDGMLTIDFTVGVQNPLICAIEIHPVLSGGAGDTDPPTAPADLAVGNLTASSLDLSWTASTDPVSGVAGYRIYRRVPATETVEQAQLLSTVTSLAFSDSGLAQGTEYEYRVIAVDGAGNVSGPSVVAATTLVPDEAPPSIPGNLVATPGLTQIELTWDISTDPPGGTGVAGYRVSRDGVEIATVTTPGYIDTPLSSGTEFDYEVTAYDAAQNTSSPAQLTVSTNDDSEAPPAPTEFTATPSYTSMSLSWMASTDPGGIEKYLVYRGPDLIGETAGTTFVDTGLIPNTEYSYEVMAVDTAENVSDAANASGTTLADNSAPSAPAYLEAVAGDGSVTLTWKASSDNVGVMIYEIRRNGSATPIATVTTPGFTDTGLENGTTYTYQVRAVDAASNVSADAADSATPRVLGELVARLNAGGNAFTDSLGKDWTEDVGFNIGSTATSTNPIEGTEDDLLYQAERYDSSAAGADLEYSFAVANGGYEVKVHFAETYGLITEAGQRVFDVYAEEVLAIDDLDIFDRAGSNTALILVFPVMVTDGQINLRFDHLGIQNPKVCGIEIHAIEATGPPTFEEWLTLNSLAGQTTGDSDAGGLSNLGEYELQMDPNDPNDDLAFRLSCTAQGATKVIALPELKPIGNYHIHRDSDLDDLGNVANRIDTVTKAEIEAMTPAERSSYTVQDNTGGARAFYRLFFEPVAD